MEDKRKIIGTLIGILGFIAAMAGLTYAMYTANVSNNNITAGHDCINITYTKGNDINASELNFVDTYAESIAKTEVIFYQNESETCGHNVGTININTSTDSSTSLMTGLTTSGQTHGVLKYTIEKEVGTSGVSETFTGYITQTGDTAVEIGPLEDTETTYTIYLWLESGTTITNADISEAVYSGYIHASARQSSTFTD